MTESRPHRPSLRKRTVSTSDHQEDEQDKFEKTHRENQQLVIYICVALTIAVAWVLGTLEFSFLWIFFLIVLTFVIWYSKVISLTERFIKYKELLVHRRRALRQSETSEWLNFIINRWWVFSSKSLSDLIKKNLDPLLNDVKPAFLEHIELESFSLGDNTPFIKYVQVYEYAEGSAGGKKAVSWSTVTQPPAGLPRLQQYQIVLEADVGLQCEDFKMIFRTRLGGKWMGMNLDLAIEKLNIAGKLQLVLHLDQDTPFPHVAMVTVSFQEKPEVWFAVRMLKAVQMMEIPFLKSWIHHLVMDGLTQALVDPGKIDIQVESMGPTNIPAKARSKSNAQGVLTVTVSAEQTKSSDKSALGKDQNPLAFVEDTKYCQLRVGEQKQQTQTIHGNNAWQDTCSFLIDELKQDILAIKCKSKVLLTTHTLAQFDINLSDYPFEHRQSVQTSVEEKIPKARGGGLIKLDLSLEYTTLTSIESIIDGGSSDLSYQSPEVSGIMYVCMHSATNLLGLDRNGFSDPYCILYSNGKKVKTTHYVCRTKNPKWEVSTEFIVSDFTKTMLSLIVYDLDGRNAREDDFLGSAHIVLTQDEPYVKQKSLTLGYNLLNVGQVDNNKLGNIAVTVIFRPVATVAKSSDADTPSRLTNVFNQDQQSSKSKGFINSAKQKLTNLRDRKTSDSMGVAGLLSMGHGILELGILQARDLVAMDSNGFSDPYCEVKINNERKFTTSIKKKTLNPVWDECVTTQLPRPGEILEIVMWDRDAFFQKDFLGCITFTVDDLKKYSRDPNHDGWFPLHRIQTGSLQLRFKVISEDLSEPEQYNQQCVGSEGSDSGFPHSQQGSPRDAAPEQVLRASSSNGTATERPHSSPGVSGVDSKPNSNGARESAQESSPALRVHKLNRHSSNRSLMASSEQGSPTYNTASSGHSTTRTLESNSGKLKKKFSFKLKRSASEIHLRTPAVSSREASSDTFRKTDSLPGSLHKKSKARSGNEFSAYEDLTMSEIYYGLEGQIIQVRGLQFQAAPVYCKVRIDNRTHAQRAKKGSSIGKVVARSSSHEPGYDVQYRLSLNVDKTVGVYKEAMLVIDLKTSGKTHVATRGFILDELIGDKTDIKRWISLGDSIEVEISLAYTYCGRETLQRRGSFSIFKTAPKGLRKIKEL